MSLYESHVSWQQHLNNQQKIVDSALDDTNNGLFLYSADMFTPKDIGQANNVREETQKLMI